MPGAILYALALAVSIARPIAAQEAARPFADLGRHLDSADASSRPSGRSSPELQAPGEAGASAASLDVLSSRLKPNDRIYVRKTSGEQLEGRFLRASEVSLALEANGQTREIPASDVQRVSRRGGNMVKKGMLFGFLTGAAVGIGAMTTSGSESEWSSGDKIFLGTVAGGGAGLFWGAIIGAVLHERTVVYSAEPPTVHVMPVLAPGRAGVVFTARF